MQLTNKRALVTGAAHRVGRAIALALAGRGASILLHYGRSRPEAEATRFEIEALGAEAWLVQADLAVPEEIERLFVEIERRPGGLDVLVNSAALFDRQPFDQIRLEDWERSLAVNLRAPFLLTQRAARLMRATPRPDGETAAIVNILDHSGLEPWPSYVQHGVAKAGLAHLTRITARELAPEIRVNAVVPGAVLPHPGATEEDPEWQALWRRIPTEKPGSPADIGAAVAFLVESEFILGATLPVDGGESLLGAGQRRKERSA
ncbi:MAG: SDR family oxidoreductase [Thermoanaerobaculia bacterium]